MSVGRIVKEELRLMHAFSRTKLHPRVCVPVSDVEPSLPPTVYIAAVLSGPQRWHISLLCVEAFVKTQKEATAGLWVL